MEIVNLLLYFALSLTRTTSSMPIEKINQYDNEMLNNFNYNENIFDKRHGECTIIKEFILELFLFQYHF